MDLSDEQKRLLMRLVRQPLVFNGVETGEARLAMLQLLIVGLVIQRGDPKGSRQIEWQITSRGQGEVARREI